MNNGFVIAIMNKCLSSENLFCMYVWFVCNCLWSTYNNNVNLLLNRYGHIILIFKVVTLEVRVLSHVMFEFEVLEYIILVEVLNL